MESHRPASRPSFSFVSAPPTRYFLSPVFPAGTTLVLHAPLHSLYLYTLNPTSLSNHGACDYYCKARHPRPLQLHQVRCGITPLGTSSADRALFSFDPSCGSARIDTSSTAASLKWHGVRAATISTPMVSQRTKAPPEISRFQPTETFTTQIPYTFAHFVLLALFPPFPIPFTDGTPPLRNQSLQ